MTCKEEALTWDDYFMERTMVAAKKSKDPSTKVGATLVDPRTNREISTGYNGFPRGVPDDHWLLQDRETKLAITIHAEENAILFAQRDLEGCTCYVWPMPPCARCTSKLAQVGIKRIVAPAPTPEQLERWKESFEMAAWIRGKAGIELVLWAACYATLSAEHQEDLELRIEYVRYAFKQLSDHCEHKVKTDPDCHHPDKEFDCMGCDPSNCPYLLSS